MRRNVLFPRTQSQFPGIGNLRSGVKDCARKIINGIIGATDFTPFFSRIYSTRNFHVEKIVTIMQNPRQYKIPNWFLNRQKDIVEGKYSQVCVGDLINSTFQ
ncbi:unnamed protein product [Nesidiocoris tenuis]|uniref:40S ribosomal protein S18 n=1 Tax=Nesidiocoris tenuis TaxID=355587 RepID=A0A6H5HHF3_9HEMI|nr:unnamed protein product [Nesidiocoris tenuis]